MLLTDEDAAIMDRFDWAPYDSEHDIPSYNHRIEELAIFQGLRMSMKYPKAHISMRDYYAAR